MLAPFVLLGAGCGLPQAPDATPAPPDPEEVLHRTIAALGAATSYRFDGSLTRTPPPYSLSVTFTGEALLPDRQAADVTTATGARSRVTITGGTWTSVDAAGATSSGVGNPPGPWSPQAVRGVIGALSGSAVWRGTESGAGARLLHLEGSIDWATARGGFTGAPGPFLPPPSKPITVALWVGEADALPRRLTVVWEALVPGQNTGQTMTTDYEMRFRDFNAPVAVP